ncbi:MAG: hypothetical protein NkDv07_0299 [Candidatus Improbicoccus devescovinae]|nr:MAG: hypothetical protein NkDv07_0299 [Candidatus Improbicoccus devescovinae]
MRNKKIYQKILAIILFFGISVTQAALQVLASVPVLSEKGVKIYTSQENLDQCSLLPSRYYRGAEFMQLPDGFPKVTRRGSAKSKTQPLGIPLLFILNNVDVATGKGYIGQVTYPSGVSVFDVLDAVLMSFESGPYAAFAIKGSVISQGPNGKWAACQDPAKPMPPLADKPLLVLYKGKQGLAIPEPSSLERFW